MNEQTQLPVSNIFQIETASFQRRRQEAIRRLVSGRTPVQYIKQRPGRGNLVLNYVDIGYMVEQANLLSFFNWSHEVLKEEVRLGSDGLPVEVGALVRVRIGNVIHEAWGQKDVMRYTSDDPRGTYKRGDIISLFDDKKAAISDGIKKCLSYFGIAADVYAGKELEYFESEGISEDKPEVETATGTAQINTPDAAKAFMRFLQDKHILPSKAMEILGIKAWTEITDWKEAYLKISTALKGGDAYR